MSKVMAMAQVERQSDGFPQRVMGWPARFKNYVEDLQLEMRRVTWPTWKQVRSTTLVVLIAVFAFAGYFLLVDFVFGRAITKIFDSLTR